MREIVTNWNSITYNQTAVPLVPFLIFPFALFINIVFPKIVETKSKTLRYVIPFVVILCCFNQNIFTFIDDFRFRASPIENTPPVSYLSTKNISAATAVIKQYTPSPTDKITVWGNCCFLYYSSNRDSVSKFIFQYPIALINQKIAEEYEREILQKSPKLIIVPTFYSWLKEMSTTLRTDIKGDITERFLFPNLLPLVLKEVIINGKTVKVPDPANIRKKYSLVYEDKGHVQIYKRND